MGSSNTNIPKLVEDPFGPYPDSQILNSNLKPTARDLLRVSSLWMDCNGTPIGFDESDFLVAPQSGPIIKHPVRFFGKLEIKSLSWLSDQGHKWLETDLRQRDLERHMHNRNNPVSGLTLKRLYGDRPGEGLRITVWIQGEKNLNALFLTSKTHPTSLLLQSKDNFRIYEVISLDVQTYEKSRKFLSRYQLLAVLEQIVKSDPHKTRVEERDIDYFVDGYLARFREQDRHHRHIFDPENDSDVDDEGNTYLPRCLRHVPRAEVFGIFAAQAEWILADQLLKRGEKLLVDLSKWHSFCQTVKVARQDARNDGVRRWGLAHGVDSDADDDESDVDLAQFGNTPEFWAKKLKVVKGKKKKNNNNNNKSVRRVETTPPSDPEPVNHRQLVQNVYDSDFSEASTPPASDSDTDPSPSQELVSRIPPCCWEVPEIPDGCFVWHCPVSCCLYTIDLLNLTEENTEGLRESVESFLLGKSWKGTKEEPVRSALLDMVSSHYNEHLKQNGVHLVETGTKKCSVESWPPPKKKVEVYSVKDEEDEDIVMSMGPIPRTPSSRLARGVPSRANNAVASSSTPRSRTDGVNI